MALGDLLFQSIKIDSPDDIGKMTTHQVEFILTYYERTGTLPTQSDTQSDVKSSTIHNPQFDKAINELNKFEL